MQDIKEIAKEMEKLFTSCNAKNCYDKEREIRKVELKDIVTNFYCDEIANHKELIDNAFKSLRKKENIFFAAKEFHSHELGGKLGPRYYGLDNAFELADKIISLGIAADVIEKTGNNAFKFTSKYVRSNPIV